MIYLNQSESSVYLGISPSTFVSYCEKFWIPTSSKRRTVYHKGKPTDNKEDIWSQRVIDNAAARIEKNKIKEVKLREKRSAQLISQEGKFSGIFNQFNSIRVKTGQV